MVRPSIVVGFSVAVMQVTTSARPAQAAACDSNVIIVLDRSCSMDNSPGGGEPRTKWEIAGEAVTTLTTTYTGQLRFGLIMFPDQTGMDCAQDGPVYVNVGAGAEQAVRDAVTGTTPTDPCVTNIDTAIAQVSSDPAFDGTPQPDGRRGFVLLISDGQQSGSCGGNAGDAITLTSIEALYAAGYPTYVVGFGDGVDPADLNAFAVAGGVPRAGMPMYFQADNQLELDMALDAIAGSIVGDPELGGCEGTPCPDDRCYGMYEMCVAGVCEVFAPDGGPGGGGDGGAGDGDGGPGGSGTGDETGGCGCRASGARGLGGDALVLLLALATVAARRRRR